MVNKMQHLGLPPQLRSTIIGLNSVMSDLGFPKWILVKWPVPPLLTFWLLLTLLLSGLRWFAMTQIIFVLYKVFEEYGDPLSDWVNGGHGYRMPRRRTTSSSRTSPTVTATSSTKQDSSTAKSTTYEEDEETTS